MFERAQDAYSFISLKCKTHILKKESCRAVFPFYPESFFYFFNECHSKLFVSTKRLDTKNAIRTIFILRSILNLPLCDLPRMMCHYLILEAPATINIGYLYIHRQKQANLICVNHSPKSITIVLT